MLTNTVIQLQRFLESLDAEKRIRNLILTGIPEDTPLPTGDEDTPEATTDEEKVTLILTKMNHGDVPVAAIHRLGKKEPTKNRATRVTLANAGDRRNILNDTAKLKTAGNSFAKVYVRKDIHPAIRKDLNRIRNSKKRQMENPENQGRDVPYDNDTRCVTVDGLIVDRFCPQYF